MSPAEAHRALRTASWPAGLCLAQLFAIYMILTEVAAFYTLLGALGTLGNPDCGGSDELLALVVGELEARLVEPREEQPCLPNASAALRRQS